MTSMMRQRALQKKLAKVNEAANSTTGEAQDSTATAGDATAEPKSPVSAKALARQRLLKKKQLEAEKKAGNEAAAGESGAAEKAAEKERQRKAHEEAERLRAEEEAQKLRAARQKGATEAMALIAQKMLNATVSRLVLQWVDNFGEELALMELEAEDMDLQAEAEADLAEEEALDEELASLTASIADADSGEKEMTVDELKAELKSAREKCLKQTQDTKRMKLELRELEEELLVTTEAMEAAEKKATDNMTMFQTTNKDLAAVQRELLAAKCDNGNKKKPAGKSRGGASAETVEEMEEMLQDANSDLATAQRQVLELKQQVQTARAAGGGGVSSSVSDKELEKLKKSVANTNKELSEAQYTILAKREQFKELLDMLTENLEPLIDMEDQVVEKRVQQMKEKIDEALDEEEED